MGEALAALRLFESDTGRPGRNDRAAAGLARQCSSTPAGMTAEGFCRKHNSLIWQCHIIILRLNLELDLYGDKGVQLLTRCHDVLQIMFTFCKLCFCDY